MHSLSRDTNLSPLTGERSLGESWSFYNYVGGGETGVVFPSTVRNPNKALCTINGRTSEVSVFLLMMLYCPSHRERCGSVVECLTRDRRVVGSSLTGVTALCP